MKAKKHKHINNNSLEIYDYIKSNKKIKYIKILNCYCYNNQLLGLTDREVKNILGYDDMNEVRPRITELMQMKYLFHYDDIIENRRKVRACIITQTGKDYLLKLIEKSK